MTPKTDTTPSLADLLARIKSDTDDFIAAMTEMCEEAEEIINNNNQPT